MHNASLCLLTFGFILPTSFSSPTLLLENLSRQRSFCFSLSYRTDSPLSLRAQFKGKWENPDKESWVGFWEREGVMENVRLSAVDERQLELTPAGWRITARGLEARVLEQLQQVFYGAVFKPWGEKRGRLLYQFIPNLPLIDPEGTKGLIGIVEIDKVTQLPIRIWCYDEEKTAEWEMRFGRFNRAGRVEMPFIPLFKCKLSPVGIRLTRDEKRKTAMILKNRLKELGVGYRMKWGCKALDLTLDRPLPFPSLELLFSQGRVELWSGWLISQGEKWEPGVRSSLILPIAGDVAKMVALDSLIAENSSLSAKPELNLPFQPQLRISVLSRRDTASAPPTLLSGEASGCSPPDSRRKAPAVVALLVNGMVVGIGKEKGAGEFLFDDIGGEEKLRIIAVLANYPPLPSGFQVVQSAPRH